MAPKKNTKAAANAAAAVPLSPKKSPARKSEVKQAKVAEKTQELAHSTQSQYLKLNVLAFVLAFILRFWRIDHPDQVVFDEVHFGKFASHYLQREFFFDLHPPLAKLMYAAVGWAVGYDGRFKFDNIGDSYIVNQVPYVAYRSLAAFLGSLTVPLVFGTLQTCGFSAISCFLGAIIIVVDSAQITQTRLILLDAALSFFMMGAVFSYVKFRTHRRAAFGLKWWLWLSSTGFFLSCVMSTKYVGLFTYLMIGVAVIMDLWQITDVRGKPVEEQVSLRVVVKHFIARLYSLIIVPFLLYLFWFYVHFNVLVFSGPGDSHMSPEFQATLKENPVIKEALDVHFFDTISIKNVQNDISLHSHPSRYPLRYDDGRISSQGQQVTGYTVDDPNNLWQILPPVPLEQMPEIPAGPIVGSQQVRLRHIATDTYLLTHDVASPSFPTNEEVTTVPQDLAFGERQQDTLFTLQALSGGDLLRSKLTHFKIRHVSTNVVVWLSDRLLPDWGFNQLEINGNKNIESSGSTWYIANVGNLETEEQRAPRRTIAEGDTAPRRTFWTDYWELQLRMFKSNNELTSTHPYMSAPWKWPILYSGISFWSSKTNTSQIYLVGNYFGWYLENTAVLLFVILYAFDKLAELREIDWAAEYARKKLNTTLLWFFLGWALHYLPFFLMGRQLFLHHYLPAQILASLLTAGLVDFVFGQLDTRNDKFVINKATKITAGVLLFGLFACFIYFAPLVYGLPLSPEGVRHRQWFKIALQFNK